MQLVNQTPFPALMYSAADPDRNEHRIVVMKVSYKILPPIDGCSDLILIQDGSVPLRLADEYWGEIGESSVKYESDLAPYKPKCDVILNGSAYTPLSKPLETLAVRLRLSVAEDQKTIQKPTAPQPLNPHMSLTQSQKSRWLEQQRAYEQMLEQNKKIKFKILMEKTLSVIGESVFKTNALLPGWHRTKPKPFTKLPLRWEYAFGGQHALYINPDRSGSPLYQEMCYSNPLGTGWVEKDYFNACERVNSHRTRHERIKDYEVIVAPQIEYHLQRQPKPAIVKQPKTKQLDAKFMAKAVQQYPYQPAGFGFTTRSWAPRIALAGTYDQKWVDEQHPYPPQDTDYGYWNAAPVDQQIDFFYPNSRLEMWNLTAPEYSKQGYLCVDFPGHRPYISLHFESGGNVLWPMITETVLIDTDNMIISLTHKAFIRSDTAPLSHVEARFSDQAEGALMQFETQTSES